MQIAMPPPSSTPCSPLPPAPPSFAPPPQRRVCGRLRAVVDVANNSATLLAYFAMQLFMRRTRTSKGERGEQRERQREREEVGERERDGERGADTCEPRISHFVGYLMHVSSTPYHALLPPHPASTNTHSTDNKRTHTHKHRLWANTKMAPELGESMLGTQASDNVGRHFLCAFEQIRFPN